MKRVVAFFLAVIVSVSSFADERQRKRELIDEILVLIDGPSLADGWLVQQYVNGRDMPEPDLDLTKEDLKLIIRLEKAKDEYRRRILDRVDRVALAEELYGGYFRDHFSVAELEQLVEFYKTRAGQKSIALLSPPHVSDLLRAARDSVNRELQQELMAIASWRTTMANMRALVSALETRATVTNDYPNVDFSELEKVLSPTYIRSIPKEDGWGTPLLYVANGKHYRLVSAGADRRFEPSSHKIDGALERRESHSFDADIIFQDAVQLTPEPPKR